MDARISEQCCRQCGAVCSLKAVACLCAGAVCASCASPVGKRDRGRAAHTREQGRTDKQAPPIRASLSLSRVSSSPSSPRPLPHGSHSQQAQRAATASATHPAGTRTHVGRRGESKTEAHGGGRHTWHSRLARLQQTAHSVLAWCALWHVFVVCSICITALRVPAAASRIGCTILFELRMCLPCVHSICSRQRK
jgi:hypothetical protein